ncbi:MAG: hypothetical protein Q8P56_03075 [Candidatus Uhrbacteria bacterium]|nr:hypothetical protein [Candidatus Uhrbacteria bacterium]
MKNERLLSFLLRAGLAVVFLYATVDATLNPTSWIGFMPQWVRAVVPGEILLGAFSLFEAILALWLFSGQKMFLASCVSSITLFIIIILNIGALDIIFRDVAILFMSLALGVFAHDAKK